MFCYFIQKRGFLDSNKNYLRDKLRECKEKHGRINSIPFIGSFCLYSFIKVLVLMTVKGFNC